MNLPAATAWSSSDVRAWPGHGGPDTRAAMSVSSRTSIRARTHTVPIGDPDGHSLSKTAISDDSSRHQGSRVVAAKWVVATFGAHALPSGGGVGSGGLPMLHGIQLKAKRAMLATTPSSPQSRTLCSGEITRVWRAEKLLRSPPKHVDALNHWAFPNLSSNDKSRPQNRGSSRRILPRAFGLLARATTHPNSESCPGIHIWTRQLDSSTARAQHRGGLRRVRLRRQPACLPCPTATRPHATLALSAVCTSAALTRRPRRRPYRRLPPHRHPFSPPTTR